jgi:hypothetical protein
MFLAGVGLGMTVPVPALGMLVGALTVTGVVGTLVQRRPATVLPEPMPALVLEAERVLESGFDLIEVDAGKTPAEYLEETLVLTFA